jgi:hypothetical protein
MWKVVYALVIALAWLFGYWAGVMSTKKVEEPEEDSNPVCDRCGNQITEDCYADATAELRKTEGDSGKMIKIDNLTFCGKCTKEMLAL